MRQRLAIPALVLLCVALASGARAQQAEKEVALGAVYKVGDVMRHKGKVEFTVGGLEGTLTQVTRIVVKEVRKSGDVVAQVGMESGHVSVAGQEQDIPETPAAKVVTSKLGRVVEMETDPSAAAPFPPGIVRVMSQFGSVLFPEKPVKPGTTWKTALDNPAVKGKKLALTTTFIGTEKVGEVDCWKVKQVGEADAPDTDAKIRIETTFWLDPANGQSVKEEGTAKDVPSQMGPMSYKMTATLVKA